MDDNLLDDIIRRLLETNNGKQVKLLESEIRQLCSASKDVFLSQPNLLELEAPIKICGKILLNKDASFFLVSACSYYLALLLVLWVFDYDVMLIKLSKYVVEAA